ncbi:hypothetical protein KBI33_01240 [Candidatus Shapirobacteria bacterium]|nr:hypothetical protein [Candidatus Shapirobacteria bacterium]
MKKKSIIIGIIILILVAAVVAATGGKKKTETPEGETSQTSEEEKASQGTAFDCKVGSWWSEGESKYQITGMEKHSIGGKSLDLCCAELTADGQKTKHCWGGENDNWSITWLTDSETGKLYEYMEIWEKEGKQCSKMFGVDGEVKAETCD